MSKLIFVIFQVCDNIDLELVLSEYLSFYHMRFQRQPQLTRPLDPSEESAVAKRKKKKQIGKHGNAQTLISSCVKKALMLTNLFQLLF